MTVNDRFKETAREIKMNDTPKPELIISRSGMMTDEVLSALVERVDWLLRNAVDVSNILAVLDDEEDAVEQHLDKEPDEIRAVDPETKAAEQEGLHGLIADAIDDLESDREEEDAESTSTNAPPFFDMTRIADAQPPADVELLDPSKVTGGNISGEPPLISKDRGDGDAIPA